MSRARGLAAFIYDFVVGDDPRIAAAVVATLGVTAALSGLGVAAWWVLPLAVVVILAASLGREL